jgi:thiamine-phosphate pyrophosphorylase
MLVTDRLVAGGEDALVRAVEAAVDGGVNAVQLREKDLAPSELLPLARRVRHVTEGRALFVVNGPLSVALDVGADGIHAPEFTVAPPPPWIYTWGRSVHSPEGARRAISEAAHYTIAGPVFQTPSHPRATPAGLGLIRDVSSLSRMPVIAIGGINRNNLRDVIQAGADGVAVVSAVLSSPDVNGAAADLARELRDAWLVRRVVP